MALRGSRIVWGIVGALSLAGTGLGLVGAQTTAGSATPPASTPSALAAGGTLADMLDAGQVVVTDGRTLQGRIQEMVDDARAAHDIIRVTCLNEKLVQVQATLESAEDRVTNLQAAQRENDLERGRHEYTLVGVLREKLDVLDRQAAQCTGQDIYETGATTVSVEVDPNNPAEASYLVPEVPFVNQIPVIPSPASATM